jgi:hypothetical protein
MKSPSDEPPTYSKGWGMHPNNNSSTTEVG